MTHRESLALMQLFARLSLRTTKKMAIHKSMRSTRLGGSIQSLKTMKRVYGGKTVDFEAFDGDSSKTETARYGIDAYPALVLVTSSSIVHYEGAFKAARIKTWLINTLGPEST